MPATTRRAARRAAGWQVQRQQRRLLGFSKPLGRLFGGHDAAKIAGGQRPHHVVRDRTRLLDRRVALHRAGRGEPGVGQRVHVGLQRRAMLQPDRHCGGEGVGQAAHRRSLPRQGQPDLAQPAIGVLARAQKQPVTADRGLLRVAPSPRRQFHLRLCRSPARGLQTAAPASRAGMPRPYRASQHDRPSRRPARRARRPARPPAPPPSGFRAPSARRASPAATRRRRPRRSRVRSRPSPRPATRPPHPAAGSPFPGGRCRSASPRAARLPPPPPARQLRNSPAPLARSGSTPAGPAGAPPALRPPGRAAPPPGTPPRRAPACPHSPARAPPAVPPDPPARRQTAAPSAPAAPAPAPPSSPPPQTPATSKPATASWNAGRFSTKCRAPRPPPRATLPPPARLAGAAARRAAGPLGR